MLVQVAGFTAFFKEHASTPFTVELPEVDEDSARDELSIATPCELTKVNYLLPID
jgi:hypothetical protein